MKMWNFDVMLLALRGLSLGLSCLFLEEVGWNKSRSRTSLDELDLTSCFLLLAFDNLFDLSVFSSLYLFYFSAGFTELLFCSSNFYLVDLICFLN